MYDAILIIFADCIESNDYTMGLFYRECLVSDQYVSDMILLLNSFKFYNKYIYFLILVQTKIRVLCDGSYILLTPVATYAHCLWKASEVCSIFY